MYHVCWSCGSYRADKRIDPSGPAAICPDCGFAHPFRALPLLLVGGASGSGKSSVCQQLLGARDDLVLLDGDIIWQPAFDTPADSYRAFFTTLLRLCLSIARMLPWPGRRRAGRRWGAATRRPPENKHDRSLPRVRRAAAGWRRLPR